MITRRKKKVPLYPAYITVILYDSSEEVSKKYSMADGKEGGFFQVDDDHLNFVIGIKSNNGVIAITHECEHIKNRIMYAIGYETNQLNDEPDAYLVGWIAGFITDVLYKHKEKRHE